MKELSRRLGEMFGTNAKHIHRPITGSLRGQGSGMAPSRCAITDRGKPCGYVGAHTIVECRCGAVGVSCPSSKRAHWTKL